MNYGKIIVTFIAICLMAMFVMFLVRDADAQEVPAYDGYVNDFANVIPDDKENELEQKLIENEKNTTNEIAVVTITTLGDQSVEEYSIKLAEAWKVGKKKDDNGIIMLFAMNDRKMRIEVGQGLEPELTDIEASRIINNTIKPRFQKSEYTEGIFEGVDAVIVGISTFEPTTTISPAPESDGSAVFWWILIIGGVIIIFLAFSSYTPFGGEGDHRIRGVWVPKEGSKWGTKSLGTIHNTYTIPTIIGGFGSGGSSSSSSSSGSGFGGGISFGGGSFSGGGASGGW